MSKILLLNGPRACGKNVAVDHIKQHIEVVDRRCKDKLFLLVQELFSVSEGRFWEIYNDRALKELPLPDFQLKPSSLLRLMQTIELDRPVTLHPGDNKPTFHISIREAMIYVSECICKPTFGADYFGIARANTIQDGEFAIDDSCGFDDEIPPTLEKLGTENVLLIRVHGRGDFDGDSRSFISDGVVPNTIDIENADDEESYLRVMMNIAKKFFHGEIDLSRPTIGSTKHWGDEG